MAKAGDWRDWDPHERHSCHDCAALEGELHVRGCDMERCPFCGNQLITCGCSLKHFYPTFDRDGVDDVDRPGTVKFVTKFHGLPEKVYKHGLPPKQRAEWERVLAKKGRVPWIQYPNLCGKCGQPWPVMFRVSDKEWEHYVEPGPRGMMLCKPCWKWIKEQIDRYGRRCVARRRWKKLRKVA